MHKLENKVHTNWTTKFAWYDYIHLQYKQNPEQFTIYLCTNIIRHTNEITNYLEFSIYLGCKEVILKHFFRRVYLSVFPHPCYQHVVMDSFSSLNINNYYKKQPHDRLHFFFVMTHILAFHGYQRSAPWLTYLTDVWLTYLTRTYTADIYLTNGTLTYATRMYTADLIASHVQKRVRVKSKFFLAKNEWIEETDKCSCVDRVWRQNNRVDSDMIRRFRLFIYIWSVSVKTIVDL